MNQQRPQSDVGPRPAEFHRNPTPWPPFNLEVFARDSERKFRAADAVEKSPTAPPPPFHPASIVPAELQEPKSATEDPSAIEERLTECAARLRPLLAQMRRGGIGREEAANVLRLELSGIEAEARVLDAEPLVAVIAGLRDVIEEMGGIAGFTHCVPLEVVVVDVDVTAREHVALAAESLGHVVRSASGLHELARYARMRPPDAVLIAASMRGSEPEPEFCRIVREVARIENLRVAVYADASAPLDEVRRDTGAEHCFAAADTVAKTAAKVTQILDDLAW